MKQFVQAILCSVCCIALLTSCKQEASKPAVDSSALAAKIDSAFVTTTDLQIRQMQASQQLFGKLDDKYTEAIRLYEAAGNDAVKKAAIFRENLRFDDDDLDTEGLPDAHHPLRQYAVLPDFLVRSNNFDLALKQNDFVVQQVKMLNDHYKNLDAKTLDAISFYEKLSKDEKVKMLSIPDAIPIPDYQQLLHLRLARVYLLQQLLMQQRLNRYLFQRINEFPQGYKTGAVTATLPVSDAAFDLKDVAQQTTTIH